MKPLFLAALLSLAACGADDPVQVSLRGVIDAAPNATGISLQLHNPPRDCDGVRVTTLATRRVIRGVVGTTGIIEGKTASLSLTEIRAGSYIAAAVATEGDRAEAFACAEGVEIVDGESTSISLTLETLRER